MHRTVPMMVWVDVDRGIAPDVEYLNSIPGVRTFASCQGTLGEGGPNPYPAQIMASWPDDATSLVEKRFEIGVQGDGWSYLHPKK